MTLSAVIAALAVLMSQPVAQPKPAPQPPVVITGEQPADQKPVCKPVDTGTLIPRRVCLPPDEWKKLESNSQDQLGKMRDFQRMRCGNATMC
jgi:uncharacterized lipoprotein YbaY